ncbi:MAG: CDP-diacylglycerol--serine O-phosphatidyltransferase [Myxococcota bacterium]|nr:CDP-diacylglycerol--serine O-phosphatidyltransferase [Myxococcota bacterium]
MSLKAVESEERTRKRRGRRGRRRRGAVATFGSLLPSLLTTGNLAAGFFAIVKASTGDPLTASYAIFVAAVFDILDGRAARLTGSESRFGAEYDSIADTVSFGLAPAVIAFHSGGLIELQWAGWVMAFVYTACGSLRLARFNVSPGRYRDRFDGLPTPAAAGMVVSTVWVRGFLDSHGMAFDLPPVMPAAGLVVLGLLMVSPIPYRSFKEVNVRGSYSATVVMVILTLVLIIEPGISFFAIGLAYVLSGPIAWWWRRRTGGALEAVGGRPGDDGAASEGAGEPGTGAQDAGRWTHE